MKALFIITKTNEMHKHVESFTCLNGNSVKLYTYDHRGGELPSNQALDSQIMAAAKDYSPDMIVYVGACAGNLPSAGLFRQLRTEIAPTVLFISDAADDPWWPKIQEYEKEKSFTVQVALDGNPHWPLVGTQITALTPLDPKWFRDPPIPHEQRQVLFGFAGNPGGVYHRNGKVIGRRPMFDQMVKIGLKWRTRSAPHGDINADAKTYKEAAEFMCQTRIMPNFAWTGSFERRHVKGRVVEAGWACSMLLEFKDSPTKHWFTPGEDYVEFEKVEEVKRVVDRYANDPTASQGFGERLRAKVIANHSPEKFWGRIFERL